MALLVTSLPKNLHQEQESYKMREREQHDALIGKRKLWHQTN